MKKNFTLKIAFILLTFSILLTGCASSTLIQSYPSGAKVYIDGEPTGVTPYLHTDTKIIGSVTNVDLVKDGYENLNTSFTRTEQANIGAIIGGFICWVPFLWTMEYKPTHNYELVPLSNQKQVSGEVTTPMTTESALKSQEAPQNQTIPTKSQKLKELKQLLDEKLINNVDFEKQKEKILNEQ